MPTQEQKKLPSLESTIRTATDLMTQIREKGNLAKIEEKLNQTLQTLTAYHDLLPPKTSLPFLETLTSNIRCGIEFAKNFSMLTLSQSQLDWFDKKFSIFKAKLLETVPLILEKDRKTFGTIIHELVQIGENFHMLELSVIIESYTKNAIQNLTSSPANLANFYSVLGTFNSYLRILQKPHKDILECIVSLLCYIRTTQDITQETFSFIEKTVNKIALSARLILSPITSEHVKNDELLSLQTSFSDAKKILPKTTFATLYTQAEQTEIKRFISLLKKPASQDIFNPIFSGFSSSLMTLHAIRKNYEPQSLNYLLFRSLLNGINTMRDYWYKGSHADQNALIANLQAMAQYLLTYLENRTGEYIKTGQLPESMRAAIFSFNKHYRDLIAFAHVHAPKESFKLASNL
ncbi:MAG: hypothetical protein P4L16_04435 [Chlamydiales bacterium]|nr:hypothetical protein [Chlamydiales bacterium]